MASSDEVTAVAAIAEKEQWFVLYLCDNPVSPSISEIPTPTHDENVSVCVSTT